MRLLSDELPDADLFAAVAEPEAAEVEATEQRETLERLAATFGADSSADDEERRAKHAARLIREASISCEGWRCEREFAADDVIHRRRRHPPPLQERLPSTRLPGETAREIVVRRLSGRAAHSGAPLRQGVATPGQRSSFPDLRTGGSSVVCETPLVRSSDV